MPIGARVKARGSLVTHQFKDAMVTGLREEYGPAGKGNTALAAERQKVRRKKRNLRKEKIQKT